MPAQPARVRPAARCRDRTTSPSSHCSIISSICPSDSCSDRRSSPRSHGRRRVDEYDRAVGARLVVSILYYRRSRSNACRLRWIKPCGAISISSHRRRPARRTRWRRWCCALIVLRGPHTLLAEQSRSFERGRRRSHARPRRTCGAAGLTCAGGGADAVTLSEEDGVRYLHFGTPWVQGAMRNRAPVAARTSRYQQQMMACALFIARPERVCAARIGRRGTHEVLLPEPAFHAPHGSWSISLAGH